jgi:flagellar hook-associated protein 1 FlgK
MSSTFSGISGALSALQAQRRGLEVSGQNIANVNTEGYSRQRVELQAKGASVTPATWSTSTGIGDGVTVTDVSRVRNEYLEGRGRTEHAQSAYLTNQAQVYAAVENVFAEPSDTALQAQLADLWAGFDDVANNPGQSGPRGALLETAATIADGLNNAHTGLSSQWSSMRNQLGAYASEVNTTAATVASLNDTIRKATAANLPVNELADKRDSYVMHLAEVAGATATVRDDGTVDVYLGGSSLVSGANARQIGVTGANRLADQAGDNVKVAFTDTGTPAALSGTMGSVSNALSTVLPTYATGLDNVAVSLISTVNAVHSTGYGLDGATGRDMFSGSSASTIRVALTDTDQIAASGVSGGSFDASKANELARLAGADTGPDKSYRLLVANLGVASQTVTRRAEIQATITDDADAARTSESGVSLDEEMTNMLSYQRAYEAASRVITTIDSVLDVIINRMAV